MFPRAITVTGINIKLRIQQSMFGPAFQYRKFSTDKEKEKSEAEQTENEKKLTANVEALAKEVKSLKEKNEDLLVKYKSAQADSEDLQRRLIKQVEEAKLFAIQAFCKDMVDVADVLGFAAKIVPLEEISENNSHFLNLYKGLSLTQESLMKVLKSHGVRPLNPINQKFDPNLHQALFQKEISDVEPNTVVEVNKIGYMLNERCIRPAVVAVSKPKSETS